MHALRTVVILTLSLSAAFSSRAETWSVDQDPVVIRGGPDREVTFTLSSTDSNYERVVSATVQSGACVAVFQRLSTEDPGVELFGPRGISRAANGKVEFRVRSLQEEECDDELLIRTMNHEDFYVAVHCGGLTYASMRAIAGVVAVILIVGFFVLAKKRKTTAGT